jgi:hypothetical protein
MRFGTWVALAFWLTGAASTVACLFGQGASPQTVVTTRASNEFSCAKEKLQVQPLGSTSFKATGCGQVATYTCMGGNMGNPYDAICTREGNVMPATGATNQPPQ